MQVMCQEEVRLWICTQVLVYTPLERVYIANPIPRRIYITVDIAKHNYIFVVLLETESPPALFILVWQRTFTRLRRNMLRL